MSRDHFPNLPPEAGILRVASLPQANRAKRSFDAVMTLEDPAVRSLRFHSKPHPDHLVLRFEDVDRDDGRVWAPSDSDVSEGLAFAARHRQGSLLVHCRHGVGRSAAMALAILADRLGPGREAEAVRLLFSIRPEATPSLVLVGKADSVLGRSGALASSLAEFESRVPGFAGKRAMRAEFFAKNRSAYVDRPGAEALIPAPRVRSNDSR